MKFWGFIVDCELSGSLYLERRNYKRIRREEKGKSKNSINEININSSSGIGCIKMIIV